MADMLEKEAPMMLSVLILGISGCEGGESPEGSIVDII